jgi:glycerophosphoryl diester phosphodiesterase
LEDVLACVSRQVMVNIELTNYTTPHDGLVDRVVELVRKMDRRESVFFSSFHLGNLVRARELMPEVRTGVLAPFWRAIPRLFTARRFPYDAFHPYKADASAWLVRYVHQRMKKMFVYTVNHPGDMKSLARLGVDGFFTDDPILAMQTLGVRS